MKYYSIIAFCLLLFLLCCKFSKRIGYSVIKENESSLAILHNRDSILEISNQPGDGDSQAKRESLKTAKPIMGYRFIITGDFIGDGGIDTLTEHFVSMKDWKETNKFYEGADIIQLMDLTMPKNPASYLSCNNPSIDTLFINLGGQILGLSYLKNEGDLDGDGGDEISYVESCACPSSVNRCYLMTYKNGKWKELYSFEIREWQLPPLPQYSKQFGLFGAEGVQNTHDDSTNAVLQKKLDSISGFIQKVRKNVIRVAFITERAEMETKTVDLRKVRKKH